MSTPPRNLLLGYAAGTLTDDERDALLCAAFDDEELLQELVDQQPLTELFADPVARAELLAALDRPSLAARFAQWWASPRHLAAVAVAATLVAAVGVVVQLSSSHGGLRVALGDGPSRSASTLELRAGLGPWMSDRPRGAGSAVATIELELDREGHSYRVGDPLRVAFRVDRPADVHLVEISAAGVHRLFPNTLEPSATTQPGRLYVVPPDGEGNLLVEGAPGPRQLVAFVFSPGTDPRSGTGLLAYNVVELTVTAPVLE